MPFKLYVDSRFRQETGGSSSDSEFSIELPHPIQVKGRACVDVVLVPNTFYVIRAGDNDRFFLSEVVSGTTAYRIVNIAEGQYNAYSLKGCTVDRITNREDYERTIFGDISGHKQQAPDWEHRRVCYMERLPHSMA